MRLLTSFIHSIQTKYAKYKNTYQDNWDEITAPLFLTEWGRRTSWGVLIGSGLFLFFIFIETITGWYQDMIISQTDNLVLPVSKENILQQIHHIPEEHLFGKTGLGEGVPITSLQLRLIGIIKSQPENLSRVIISEAGQPGKVYAIGDSLPSGILVNAITEDGVILENNGQMEKLPLLRTPLAFQGMPQPI